MSTSTADRRQAVRLAVHTEMASRGWNISQLREASGVDAGTLGDFLNGNRWPRTRTLAAVERAVEWPPGTVMRILSGEPPPAAERLYKAADLDAVVVPRPAGISDEEWEYLTALVQDFAAYQLDRAQRGSTDGETDPGGGDPHPGVLHHSTGSGKSLHVASIAARRGRSSGRTARAAQDQEGEESQDPGD